MKSNCRKDKNRKAKYLTVEEGLIEEKSPHILGKNILLLVEGETEESYFQGIKENPWLKNNLAGIEIQLVGNLGKAIEESKKAKYNYTKIWIVSDNDKRNAFILEENSTPFFESENLIKNEHQNHILQKLKSGYISDSNRYFLSIYDYLQWLKTVITTEEIVEFWDLIHHYTPHKKKEFADFDKEYHIYKKDEIYLAYSCIAFEFWLILHFEQNSTPFLWIEHNKGKTLDAFDYLKTIVPDYVKGSGIEQIESKKTNEKTLRKVGCNAYEALLVDYNKNFQTIDDEWEAILRIIKAYQNTLWLQKVMQPTLERQCGKWYEVNPYVLGMDDLVIELLNIKKHGESFDYSEMKLQFGFNSDTKTISLNIEYEGYESIIINQTHSSCFKIRVGNNEYEPIIESSFILNSNNREEEISLQYDFPIPNDTPIVLILNDFRYRAKSPQLLVIVNN